MKVVRMGRKKGEKDWVSGVGEGGRRDEGGEGIKKKRKEGWVL